MSLKQKTDIDMTDSLMKDKVIEIKRSTAMTDREKTTIIVMMITKLTVTDTIRVKMIEPEDQLMTLMKEEDTGRGEMNPAENHTETSPETSPEMHQREDPTDTSPGTFLGIDIGTGGNLREAAALTTEEGTIMMIGTGRPATVRADSERVARSP